MNLDDYDVTDLLAGLIKIEESEEEEESEVIFDEESYFEEVPKPAEVEENKGEGEASEIDSFAKSDMVFRKTGNSLSKVSMGN